MNKPLTPPNNELSTATNIAEQALIGSLLIEGACQNAKAILEVRKLVAETDFRGYYENSSIINQIIHTRIFHAMLLCQYPHQINVANKMNELGILKSSDCAYMSECIARVPCSLDYIQYARSVKDYSLRRNGIKALENTKGVEL